MKLSWKKAPVNGPTNYTIAEGDTLESIAEKHRKAVLNIKRLNAELELDWANLTIGTEIQIPGDLLIELDPLSFKERINSQKLLSNVLKFVAPFSG